MSSNHPIGKRKEFLDEARRQAEYYDIPFHEGATGFRYADRDDLSMFYSLCPLANCRWTPHDSNLIHWQSIRWDDGPTRSCERFISSVCSRLVSHYPFEVSEGSSLHFSYIPSIYPQDLEKADELHLYFSVEGTSPNIELTSLKAFKGGDLVLLDEVFQFFSAIIPHSHFRTYITVQWKAEVKLWVKLD